MESRLKERLIGAAVLVLLGVWLIPWVLDGPEAIPEAADDSLSLPAEAESSPVRTQTIDLEARRYSNRPADDDTAVLKPVGSADEPSSARATSAAASAPAPAPSAPAATPRSSAPDTATAARAESAPNGPTWMVQLGSFGDESNARRLADRVGTYGYEADVSGYRAGGRTMHRVRVGPAASRNEAEATASSLAAHGFVAQVVAAD